MNFGFSQEQELLRQEARKLLDERCPLEEVRKLAETPLGYAEELWRDLSALGWSGLTIPEAYGGAGLGWVDLVVLLEETGRSLFPSPLISTTLAASALLDAGSEEQRARLLPRLADGSRIGTLALFDSSDAQEPGAITLAGRRSDAGYALSGQKRFVTDPDAADLFVVAFRSGEAADDLCLALVERESAGVSSQSFPTLDRTKRMGNLALDGVRVSPEDLLGEPGRAAPAIARLLDRGAVAVTGEMIGAAEGALDLIVQYARDRIQFDQPIGKYQAVKHPLAEMYVDVESFKSLLYYAAWALDESAEEVARSASLAKAYASDAFARIGIDGVQLHGAVGYTAEYDIQLYLKRSKWARPVYGDADHHYDRVARIGGL